MTKSDYRRLGDYIEQIDKRNTIGLGIDRLRGINTLKQFMKSRANLVGVDLSSYKIVDNGCFAYNPNTARMGDKICVALNVSSFQYLVSSIYPVFRIKHSKKSELLPDYLMMWFIRSEFDRYARYHSHGSAREIFSWEEMCDVYLPVPEIDEQRRIVAEYQAIEARITSNEHLIEKLEETAQTIYKKMFVDDIDPENLPAGWSQGTLEDLGEITSGATPSTEVPEYWDENGISWLSPADLSREETLFMIRGSKSISTLGYKSASTKLLPKGTVLFSSRAPIGLMAIADGELCTNQGFKSIVPKDIIGTEYCYYVLLNLRDRIANENTGATFAEVSGSTMKLYEAIVPSKDACKAFSDKVLPLHNHIKNIEKESKLLLTIKSLLLSKLTQ